MNNRGIKKKALAWLVATAMVVTLIPAAAFAFDYDSDEEIATDTDLTEDSRVLPGVTLTLKQTTPPDCNLNLKEFNLINRGNITSTYVEGVLEMKNNGDTPNALYNYGTIDCDYIYQTNNGYIFNYEGREISSDIWDYSDMTIYNDGALKGDIWTQDDTSVYSAVIHNYGEISGNIFPSGGNGSSLKIYNHSGKITSPEIMRFLGNIEIIIYNYNDAEISTPTGGSAGVTVINEDDPGFPQFRDVSIADIPNQPAQPGTTGGKEKRVVPEVRVTDATDNKILNEGTDYIVSCENNIDNYVDSGVEAIAHINFTGDYEQVGTIPKTFKITKDISSEGIIIEDMPAETYTGKKIKPDVIVTDGEETLVEWEDYYLTYRNNVGVSTQDVPAVVTIKGMGLYHGTTEKTFTISQKNIAKATVTVPDDTYTFNGEAHTPPPTVEVDGYELREGVDYYADDIEYRNNTNAGTATVKVEGIGNYTGIASGTFTIEPQSIDDAALSYISDVIYSGDEFTPTPTVTLNGDELTKDTDYEITYSGNIDAGTATVTVTGKGNYTGTINGTFTIGEKDIGGARILGLLEETHTYNGSAFEPKPVVTMDNKVLIEDTDYEVAYSNNTNAGTATVTVTGKGNYTGTAGGTFTIEPQSITGATVSSIEVQPYTGEALMPEPTVTVNDDELIKDTDYELSYSDNTDAGKSDDENPPTVTVTGIGNYQGAVDKNFTIEPQSINEATIPDIPNKTYNGLAFTPPITVNVDDRELEEHKDYTVAYSENIDAGQATVTVTGKDNYTGSVSKTFKIIPGKAAVSKLTKGKKKMTVYIKSQKAQGVSGYQIGYKKKGGKYKYVTTTSTKKVIKKLKSKKYYYAKVRAYKKIGDKKYYGAWSSAKRVKVK